jgi:hypothetical protein
MGADYTRGANSPIVIKEDDDRGEPMMILAVMIILVVFIFVIFAIFALKREHHGIGGNGIAELAGAAMLAKTNHNGEGAYNYHMAHDNMRDNLREFAHIREEIKDTASTQSRESDRYFFETNKNIDHNKFEAYKNTKESEEKILLEIKASEDRRLRDDNLRKDMRIIQLESEIGHQNRYFTAQPFIRQTHISANQGYDGAYA